MNWVPQGQPWPLGCFDHLSERYSIRYNDVKYSRHREDRKRISYTSGDKKSDKERYIRVAAIDMVTSQGI